MSETPRGLLTDAQLAEYLQVGRKTIGNLVSTHGLPVVYVGGLRRFELGAVESWVRSRTMVKVRGPQGRLMTLPAHADDVKAQPTSATQRGNPAKPRRQQAQSESAA